jgi:hypothetical protein
MRRNHSLGHQSEFLPVEQLDSIAVTLRDQARIHQPPNGPGEGLAGEIQMTGHVTLQAREFHQTAFTSGRIQQISGESPHGVAENHVFDQTHQVLDPMGQPQHQIQTQRVVVLESLSKSISRQ